MLCSSLAPARLLVLSRCKTTPTWNGRISFRHQLRRRLASLNSLSITRNSSSIQKIDEEEFDQKELVQLRSQICELLEEGDDVTARAIIDANYELLQEQLDDGIQGVSQAALLDVLAQAHMDIADLKGAGRLLQQLENVMKLHSSPKNYVDVIFDHMGMMYAGLRRPQQALKCFSTCLEVQEELYGSNDSRIARALLGCAENHEALGNKEQSMKIYHRLANILESSKDEEALVLPLSRVGAALADQGKLTEAEVVLNRALRIAKQAPEEEQTESIVQILSMLARLKRSGDDLEGSVSLYKEALKLMESCMQTDYNNHILERIRTSYATVLALMKRHREAQELIEANLLTKQTAVGPSDPSLIVHLNNLAASYAASGDSKKCEAVLRRYLALATSHFGPVAPQVAEPLELLARLLHNQGKQLEEAESLARQALQICEKTHGDEHPLTGEACNCLAAILYTLSSYRESEAVLLRRLRIQEKWMGDDNIGLIPTIERLLMLHEKLGKDAVDLKDRLKRLKAEELR